jgi:hypothetical protein
MNSAINEYTIHIAIGFITSMGFGLGLLKTYDLFRRALKENNRFKLWWAFTSTSFFLILVVYLFSVFARKV